MLDFIFEFLIELIMEGVVEVSENKKISNWIRYPLILLILLFCSVIILGIFIVGIVSIKENIILSVILIALSIFMLVAGILKFKEIYIEKKNKCNNMRI